MPLQTEMPCRRKTRSRRGFSLVLVIAAGLVLTIAVLSLIGRTGNTLSIGGRSRDALQADSRADIGIARARARIADAFSTNIAKSNLLPRSNDAVNGLPALMMANGVAPDEQFVPAAAGGQPYYQFVVNGGAVRYTIEELLATDTNNPFNLNCAAVPAPVNNWCSRVQGNSLYAVKTFRITSALVPNGNAPWSGVDAFLAVSRDSSYNKFAFYENDMEVSPGGGFVIRGQVHSNENLFLNNGVTLRQLFATTDARYRAGDSLVSATRNIYLGRKVGDTTGVNVNVERTDGSLATLSRDNDSVSTFNGFIAEHLSNKLYGDGKSDQLPTTDPNYAPNNPPDTWARASDWAANAASTSVFDGRLAAGVSEQNLPDAEDIDPNDANNRFAQLVNTPAPASDPTASGGFYIETRNDATKSTLIKKDGQPIAIVELDSASGTYKEYAVAADGTSKGAFRNPTLNQNFFPPNTFTLSNFYNGREGASTSDRNVFVTNIDVELLGQAKQKIAPLVAGLPSTNGDSLYPASGLVYAVRKDAQADAAAVATPGAQTPDANRKPNGFRLRNGSRLPGNGLNFVTGNPVYVQGDYNKHQTTQATGSVSLDPAAADYSAGNDTWKNSMVVTDSLTVLSNNWSDASNASSTRTVQAARDTEVNSLIISGITKSYASDYNGGLENYPRLLEDWGSLNSNNASRLKIRGAFIQGFYSRYGTGRWGGVPTYYGVPQNRNVNGETRLGRDWGLDVNFLTTVSPAARFFVTGGTYIGGLGIASNYTSINRMNRQQFDAYNAARLGWVFP